MKSQTIDTDNILSRQLGGFHTTSLNQGLIYDESLTPFPSRMLGYVGANTGASYGTDFSTTFGFVFSGEVTLSNQDNKWTLNKGFYFSMVGKFEIKGNGKVVLFERIGIRGVFQVGGPLESIGRVAYISGCNDSILVFPPRAGDPCMNCLWIPELVNQTMHIHPTVRYAMIISGRGRCVTPYGEIPLVAGNVFKLDPMSRHCFITEDSGMVIVTYHPDSDWGPSDDRHPMLNRTLVHSAS